jgi:hypothetical protein
MRHERSIISICVTAGLLASVSCGGGDDAAEGTPTRQTSAAEVVYECPPVEEQQPTDGPVQVTTSGLCSYDDGLGHVTYGVVVRNTGPEPVYRVLLDVDVHDSTGIDAGRAIPHLIHKLEPGEELGIGYSSLVEASAVGGMTEGRALGVRVTVPDMPDPAWPEDGMTVSDVSTTLEGGTRSTTFAITSGYDFPRDSVEVFVVYRDAQGLILGGEQDLIAQFDPHGTVTHTIGSNYANPAVTQASVYVNDNPEPPRPAPPA